MQKTKKQTTYIIHDLDAFWMTSKWAVSNMSHQEKVLRLTQDSVEESSLPAGLRKPRLWLGGAFERAEENDESVSGISEQIVTHELFMDKH